MYRIKEHVFWRRFLWQLQRTLRKSYDKELDVAVRAVKKVRVLFSIIQMCVYVDCSVDHRLVKYALQYTNNWLKAIH